MPVELLSSTGTQSSSGWNIVGPSAHGALSDASDATYLWTTSSWKRFQLYPIENTSAASENLINHISIEGRCKCETGVCTNDIYLGFKNTENGTTYTAPPVTAPAVIGNIDYEWVTNPADSNNAWTSAAIDDLVIVTGSLLLTSPTGELRVYELWIDVDYSVQVSVDNSILAIKSENIDLIQTHVVLSIDNSVLTVKAENIDLIKTYELAANNSIIAIQSQNSDLIITAVGFSEYFTSSIEESFYHTANV
jgi:hypothetical protein